MTQPYITLTLEKAAVECYEGGIRAIFRRHSSPEVKPLKIRAISVGNKPYSIIYRVSVPLVHEGDVYILRGRDLVNHFESDSICPDCRNRGSIQTPPWRESIRCPHLRISVDIEMVLFSPYFPSSAGRKVELEEGEIPS